MAAARDLWDGDGQGLVPPGFELESFRAHPAFAEAVRACAAGMVGLHSRSRMLGWFLSDRTLAVLSQIAVCMDADARDDDPRSGLTPGRFKSFCVAAGMCSEGRAAAILAFMRLTGHLEAGGHGADRRVTRLRPSAKMLETTRARTRTQFASVALLRPELAPAIERFGRPAFDRGVYAEFLARFVAGQRIMAHAPALRLFSDRDVGMLILFALMLGAGTEDALPPAGPVPLSIAALSRRFKVSRTHVLRLVRDAETAGLLVRHGARGDRLSFSAELRDGLSNVFAGMFQLAGLCARAGLASEEPPETR